MYDYLENLVTPREGFIFLLNLTFSLSMKDEYVAETSTTIELIEASLAREDVEDKEKDKENSRYMYR